MVSSSEAEQTESSEACVYNMATLYDSSALTCLAAIIVMAAKRKRVCFIDANMVDVVAFKVCERIYCEGGPKQTFSKRASINHE